MLQYNNKKKACSCQLIAIAQTAKKFAFMPQLLINACNDT